MAVAAGDDGLGHLKFVRNTPNGQAAETVRARQDNVKLGCVLSNSFGFGGTNASVVFKHVDA